MPEPSTSERLKLLAARPVLSGVGPAVLQDIDAAMESVHVPGGARLVERSQTGTSLIVLVQGGLQSSFVGPDGRHTRGVEYSAGAAWAKRSR